MWVVSNSRPPGSSCLRALLLKLRTFHFQQVLFPVKVHHRRSCFLFLAAKYSMREKRGREAPARRVTFVGLVSRSRWAREGEVLPVRTLEDRSRSFFFFFSYLLLPAVKHSTRLTANVSQSALISGWRPFLQPPDWHIRVKMLFKNGGRKNKYRCLLSSTSRVLNYKVIRCHL